MYIQLEKRRKRSKKVVQLDYNIGSCGLCYHAIVISKCRVYHLCAKVFWSVSSRALSSKNNNVRVRRSKLIHTQLTDQVWRDERMAVLVPKDKRARVTYIRTLPTYFLLCRLATAIRRRNKFTLAKPAYIWPVSKVGGDGNQRCVCRLWKWKQR